ncbi:MAG: hypothetical protein M1828_006115 [Chrysothrix sp. TS-e1954]|nr:MAG: hypothetical protein M1828_006115 [Chrysothrix sp. TS-e1954]
MATTPSPSLTSLHTLDPSPVEETPSTAQPRDSYFPPTRTSSLGLGHSAPYYLHRAQKYSTYLFSAFAALHITNTSLLPLLLRSTPAASTYLLLTRPYYQSFPLEHLFITLPLLTHVTSGILLRLYHRRASLRHSGAETKAEKRSIKWPRLSWQSVMGYAAVPLVAGHVGLNRLLPLWEEGGSSGIGLEFVGHGVAVAPVAGFLAYLGLVGVVGSHVVWGWARWMGWDGRAEASPGDGGASSGGGGASPGGGARARGGRLDKKRQWTVAAANALIVSLWLAGGLGVVGRNGRMAGWVGRMYDELYRRVPWVGMWV